MSVAKGDRKESSSNLETARTMKGLCVYTIQICKNEKNFPKRDRWILTAPIVKCAVKAYAKVLENAKKVITEKVNALGLEMNRKTQISPLKNGIRFLKWRFILTDSGKVIRRISRQSVVKERRKLKKLAGKIRRGEIPEEYLWTSFQSWRANARRGNAGRQIYEMEKLYNQLKEEIENGRKGDDGGAADEGCSEGGSCSRAV
ncbi:MAG: hypothetical protein IKE24_03240 [Clostridia bacterium]|nr:hypothetical protein [Clostridia bacterium]